MQFYQSATYLQQQKHNRIEVQYEKKFKNTTQNTKLKLKKI